MTKTKVGLTLRDVRRALRGVLKIARQHQGTVVARPEVLRAKKTLERIDALMEQGYEIAESGRLFICGGEWNGKPLGVYCPDCIPKEIDLGDDEVELWHEGDAGWISAPICDVCSIAISVYVDSPQRNDGPEALDKFFKRVKALLEGLDEADRRHLAWHEEPAILKPYKRLRAFLKSRPTSAIEHWLKGLTHGPLPKEE